MSTSGPVNLVETPRQPQPFVSDLSKGLPPSWLTPRDFDSPTTGPFRLRQTSPDPSTLSAKTSLLRLYPTTDSLYVPVPFLPKSLLSKRPRFPVSYPSDAPGSPVDYLALGRPFLLYPTEYRLSVVSRVSGHAGDTDQGRTCTSFAPRKVNRECGGN